MIAQLNHCLGFGQTHFGFNIYTPKEILLRKCDTQYNAIKLQDLKTI